ncbi:MAG: hypothetical protein ACRDOK_24960, partial [Streptosporangiaceae bacterium]
MPPALTRRAASASMSWKHSSLRTTARQASTLPSARPRMSRNPAISPARSGSGAMASSSATT